MAQPGPLIFNDNRASAPQGLGGLAVGGGGLIVSTALTPAQQQHEDQRRSPKDSELHDDADRTYGLSEVQRKELQARARKFVQGGGKAGATSTGESALLQFATGSTLLPSQLAELVTHLSLLARVSLKSTAFFIEAVLEAAKYGTGMGLGLTRRALITAVGTARAVHALRGGEDWDPTQPSSKQVGSYRSVGNDAFLAILDRYTSLGIYLIHSTFTMAELLAMSGFYLADSSIKAGLSAADESVRLIDGIFGSNETSRALSSVITLVRKELTQDEDFAKSTGGSWWGLAALTKALTTFAVLQNATYRRTAQTQRLRVLYDCTILGEAETKSWRAMIVGPGSFVRSGAAALKQLGPPPALPTRSSSHRSEHATLNGGGGGSITERRKSRGTPSLRSSMIGSSDEGTAGMRRSRSYFGGLEEPCLTDVGSNYNTSDSLASLASLNSPSSLSESHSILEDLDYLVGADETETEDDEGSMARSADMAHSDSTRTLLAEPRSASQQRMKRHELPADLREVVRSADEQELRQGVQVEDESGEPMRDVRRVVRKRGQGKEEVYEITTETVEVVETTTTVRSHHGPAPSSGKPEKKSGSKFSRRLANPFKPLLSHAEATRTDRDLTTHKAGFESESVRGGRRERTTTEEEEWLEVTHTQPSGTLIDLDRDDGSDDEDAAQVRRLIAGAGQAEEQHEEIPELPNGRPATSIATVSRQEALDHPEESKARLQYTLRTMTRKLIQKKRVVRRVQVDDGSEEEESTPSPPRNAARWNAYQMDWQSETPCQRSPETSRRSAPINMAKPGRSASGSGEVGGLRGALNKAKTSLMGGASSSGSNAAKNRVPSSSDVSMISPASTPMSTSPTPPPTPPPRIDFSRSASDRSAAQAPQRRRGARTAAASAPRDYPDGPPIVEPRHKSSAAHAGSGGPATPGGKRRSRALSISSMRSFASRTHTHTQTTTTQESGGAHEGPEGAPGTFPRQHLVKNLRRFMRHSSAAYGQNFMRILGISEADVIFADTTKHHSNIYAYCHHVGIPVDHMLLSSFTQGGTTPFHSHDMSPIVNYISIDDESQAIVLTCRGTMGLSDILTDLTCVYEDIWVDGGKPENAYKVHSGMAASARRLSAGGLVRETLKKALESRPDYGLVLTGHSMGGGVAALLALLWSSPTKVFQERMLAQPDDARAIRHPRLTTPFVTAIDSGLPPGRPIHCFGYGIPAVCSSDLSKHCKGLVTSVVHGFDIVPNLSLGVLQDLKNVAQSLSDERESIMAQEIVGRVVGLYQRRRRVEAANGAPSVGDDDDDGIGGADLPRPPDVPAHERELRVDLGELADGRTRNRAAEANYRDPRLTAEPKPAASARETVDEDTGPGRRRPPGIETDDELADWLWSLIKTMRADMSSFKLYPPGQVYCIEAFAVYVTPNMTRDYHAYDQQQRERLAASRAEAHRVILRQCDDVEKRFGEPVFARSMLRDHTPPSYELALQLLWESVMSPEERERQDAREANGQT